MRRVWSLALVVIMVFAFTTVALAKKKKAKHERKDILSTSVVAVKATVEAIDYSTHTITLKGPKGVPLTYRVDHSVKNFDQVQRGDQVTARYLEGVAIYVDKPQGKPKAGEIGSVQAALRGKKVSQFSVKIWETGAGVEAVDYRKHTLSVKGHDGRVLTFKTDKRVKNLREVKAGDEVVVRYTEPLVIAIEK